MAAIVKTHVAMGWLEAHHADDAFGAEGGPPPTVYVVIPLLSEASRVQQMLAHWSELIEHEPSLMLVVVTTQREEIEAGSALSLTRKALHADELTATWQNRGRLRLLHFPEFNLTYREQLAFALAEVCHDADPNDYIYVANADSRLGPRGIEELLATARTGVGCAQQSAVFLGNFSDLSSLPAAEALWQSSWTIEVEIFRSLAGSGRVPWIPRSVAKRWYQHAVGHGLLLNVSWLARLGGLPASAIGLEDAALGFAIRSSGESISPLRTLEIGDAPTSIRALMRQRSTWVRGPLGVVDYADDPSKQLPLIVQGLYAGLRWGFGLPWAAAELLYLGRQQRGTWLLLYLLRIYAPLARIAAGSRRTDLDGRLRVEPAGLVRAVAVYWAAPLIYWLGGLRGVAGICRQLLLGERFIQPKTEDR